MRSTWSRMQTHIHYVLYSSIILLVLLMHANAPIESVNSKLTIVLMSLLIFGEATARIVKSLRSDAEVDNA